MFSCCFSGNNNKDVAVSRNVDSSDPGPSAPHSSPAQPRMEDQNSPADAHNPHNSPALTLPKNPTVTSNMEEDQTAGELDQNVGASVSTGRPKGNAVKIFSYNELAKVTNNFDPKCKIEGGSFGPVYKGESESTDHQVVAVKWLNIFDRQGEEEFWMEVHMLSHLRHPNLVNLIGYCSEGAQRFLVYDSLPSGSLDNHLRDQKPESKPLEWKTRMTIALGIATGLKYLHTEATPPVIFRDLTTGSIVLDQNFHPKLTDFGPPKHGYKTHASARLMGTPGFAAPEGKLSTKSDVYGFGAILVALITGQHERSSRSAAKLAAECLQQNPDDRPTMLEVVKEMNRVVAQAAAGGGQIVRGKEVQPEEASTSRGKAKMTDI